MFGFGMLPAGWAALMGDDADKLTDRAMNAADLFGPWIEEVATTLEQAATVDEKLVIGNTFARGVLQRSDPAPMWFLRTVGGRSAERRAGKQGVRPGRYAG